MIFKETNGAQLPSSARLVVVKVGTKDLVMKRNRVMNEKEFDYFGHALSFTRLNIPTCAQALSSSDPTVIGNDIIGNWQVHYRTTTADIYTTPTIRSKFLSRAKESTTQSSSVHGALRAATSLRT